MTEEGTSQSAQVYRGRPYLIQNDTLSLPPNERTGSGESTITTKKKKFLKKKFFLELAKHLNKETIDIKHKIISFDSFLKLLRLVFLSFPDLFGGSIITGVATVYTKDPDSKKATILIPTVTLALATLSQIRELTISVEKLNDSYMKKLMEEESSSEISKFKKIVKTHGFKLLYIEIITIIAIAAVIIPLTAKYIGDETNDYKIGGWSATEFFVTLLLQKSISFVNGFITHIIDNQINFIEEYEEKNDKYVEARIEELDRFSYSDEINEESQEDEKTDSDHDKKDLELGESSNISDNEQEKGKEKEENDEDDKGNEDNKSSSTHTIKKIN